MCGPWDCRGGIGVPWDNQLKYPTAKHRWRGGGRHPGRGAGKARGGDVGRQCVQAGRAQELKSILRAVCVGVGDGSGFGYCLCVCFVWFGEEREESSL